MLSPDISLADLVLSRPSAARILQRHRIDFCCRGEQRLDDACHARGVATAMVLQEIDQTEHADGLEVDPREMSTAELIDFIVRRHHGYLREALPFVLATAAKVARVHGDRNERLRSVQAAVEELAAVLEPHLDDEEDRLFPELVQGRAALDSRRELADMKHEHEQVGALLWRLRAAADDFRAPDWACRSYRALFAELEKLELDVLRHVHLENHVLAPRFAQ